MRKQKIISISDEMFDSISKNPLIDNFSEWVERKYWEEFSKDYILRKINEYTQEIERLKEIYINMKTQKIVLSEKEYNFFKKEIDERLQRGADMKGIYNYYINAYSSKLTKKQFVAIYNKIKEGDEIEINRYS